jgi:RNA polymerase sigma-70 factor (sigma-B/F/G subfamily)
MPPGERETPGTAVDGTDLATAALFARMHDPAVGQNGRLRLRAEIIELNLSSATRLAHRYGHRGQAMEDLEQVAALALVKAVDGFDPRRGRPFFGYLLPTVLGELKRHFRDKAWDLHIPRRLQERHLELKRTQAALTQRLQRSPSIRELGAALELSDQEVLDGLAAGSAYDADSLNARLTPDADSCERQDLVGTDDPALTSACDRLAIRGLLDRLPERDRFIVARYFFGNATQERIADELGMSQMNVSRLLRRTLEQLRRQLEEQVQPAARPETARLDLVVQPAGRGSVVVAVRGDVDEVGAARLRTVLVDAAVQRCPQRLTVDLRHARFLGPRGLRALVDAYRACGHGGTRLLAVNASPELYSMLCRLGVARLFPCRPYGSAGGKKVVERQAQAPAPVAADPTGTVEDAPAEADLTGAPRNSSAGRRSSTPRTSALPTPRAGVRIGLSCIRARPAPPRSLHELVASAGMPKHRDRVAPCRGCAAGLRPRAP